MPLNLAFVVALEQRSADQAGDDRIVGEDTDNDRVVFDFAVQWIKRVGLVQLRAVLTQEVEIGEHVVHSLPRYAAQFRKTRRELLVHKLPLGMSLRSRPMRGCY